MYIKRNILMVVMVLLFITGIFYLDAVQKNDLKLLSLGSSQSGATLSVTTKRLSSHSSDIETLNRFFGFVDSRMVSEAVALFVPDITDDSSARESWKRQLTAFTSVHAIAVKPDAKDQWNTNLHIYRVDLVAQMDPSSAHGPVPYYGYDNGLNTRWIVLKKLNDVWRILSISTSP